MFKIGDFSRLARVSVGMLRYYDEEGLFHPHRVDETSGYRYYRASQLDEIAAILRYRDMGFQIAEIRELLLASTEIERRELLLKKKEETSQHLVETKERLAMIEAALVAAGKEKTCKARVIVKRIEGFRALSLRDEIPSYDAEGLLWQRLGTLIEGEGIAVGNRSYATYHDEGYVEGPVDVEVVVIEVVGDCSVEAPFALRWSEPIEKCATLEVHGDFSGIAPGFRALGHWIEDQGFEIAGPAREIPVRGPWNEENPENYLNELQIPVR